MNAWQRLRPSTRRLAQLYSALLYNAHVKGFVDGSLYRGGAKLACALGLNCYSCPGAAAACPLGALQNALAAAGHGAGWYVIGILLLFGVTLGRTVCGWLCPMGLVQELLHRIPTPKLGKGRATRVLSLIKYLILAVFVVAVPVWYGARRGLALPAFCKYICPAGTFEGSVGLMASPANETMFSLLGELFTRKFVILVAVGLACVFCYRAFCRFLCPLGAVYSLFNRFNVVGVKVDASRCNGCGACVRGCGMDVRRVGDRECIHCARCMHGCAQGAISMKAGKLTLKGPERTDGRHRRRVWAVLAALLCFALVWFNVLDPSLRPVGESAFDEADMGHEVGQMLPDFSIACLDGTEFHLADTCGRVVFINLWASWCAPCVEELPLFVDLVKEHPDDVAVIAVHSPFVTDDPAAFLADREWATTDGGYAVPFALDADEIVWHAVNGGSALPQTIVLDRSGKVVYNQQGSVTAEALRALCDQAAGE